MRLEDTRIPQEALYPAARQQMESARSTLNTLLQNAGQTEDYTQQMELVSYLPAHVSETIKAHGTFI